MIRFKYPLFSESAPEINFQQVEEQIAYHFVIIFITIWYL